MSEILEPHGRFTMKGTVTFPTVEKEEPEKFVEFLEKPVPWGWIFLGGSIILSLAMLVGRR